MVTSAPNITLLGAGSTLFTHHLLGDILFCPELAQAHIALCDNDVHRLQFSCLVTYCLNEALGA